MRGRCRDGRNLDRAVEDAGRRHFSGTGTGVVAGRGRRWRLPAAAAAIAAVALLAFVLVVRPGGGPALAHDFNGDGRLDILDALRLARHLDTPPEGADVNGDGRVDRADVDTLCRTLVRSRGAGGAA